MTLFSRDCPMITNFLPCYCFIALTDRHIFHFKFIYTNLKEPTSLVSYSTPRSGFEIVVPNVNQYRMM